VPSEDDGYDEPWTDGHKPHTCGYYVEEHRLITIFDRYTEESDQRWMCPVHAS